MQSRSGLFSKGRREPVRVGVVLLLVSLCLSACAGKPPPLAFVTPEHAAGRSFEVIVATSRAPVDDASVRYGDGRADGMSIDAVSVWVPGERQPGSIVYPSANPDPDREFGVISVEPVPDEQFVGAVNSRLAELKAGKSVFLFVHGYNVPYSSGVYRIAQMLADFENQSAPIHYSWPSAGRAVGYMYDRDSVQFARDSFTHLLKRLAKTDAEAIFLMGHSMGALLVMESLRQLSLTGDSAVLEKVSPLVLASPDIDVDVFRRQLQSLSVRPDPIVVFVAEDDNALRLSKTLRGGHPRVGEGTNIAALQESGVAVIDLSDVELGDGTQHSAFASSPELISLIRQASVAERTLNDADAEPVTIESSLERLSEFTKGIIFLPKRVIDPQ